MMTQGAEEDEQGKPPELSPVEHIAKYFKRLKQARDEDDGNEPEQSQIMRPPPVLRQESWTIKRSESTTQPSTAHTNSVSENSDPLADLDKRFPGFKKGKGYLKLE